MHATGQSASAEPSSHHQAQRTQQDGAAGHYSQGLQPCSFDYVLLDPPCSALGLRPRLLHDIALPQLRKVASYQRAMIHNAVALLKPGGQLVYCTCTINPGEQHAGSCRSCGPLLVCTCLPLLAHDCHAAAGDLTLRYCGPCALPCASAVRTA